MPGPMATAVLRVDPVHPELAVVARAAAVLWAGGLVAFPTETVYGLGANGLSGKAVAGIFAAKGRPSSNPIILHAPSMASARALAGSWNDWAERLAARFWPGPLTLVVERSAAIPDVVTAGGPTVALRVPSHPVALALLAAVDFPLAAPSANRSTRLSPTQAEHVLAGLDGRIGLILDGGPTPGGIESTVLDVAGDRPRLLRPGLLSVREIEAVVGPVERGKSSEGVARSPGLQECHYAPVRPLELAPAASVGECLQACRGRGERVAWLSFGVAATDLERLAAVTLALATTPGSYAAELFSALHVADAAAVDRIVVTLPPTGDDWLGIHDRLARAAHRAQG